MLHNTKFIFANWCVNSGPLDGFKRSAGASGSLFPPPILPGSLGLIGDVSSLKDAKTLLVCVSAEATVPIRNIATIRNTAGHNNFLLIILMLQLLKLNRSS